MSDCWQYVLEGMLTTSHVTINYAIGECRESVSKLHGY